MTGIFVLFLCRVVIFLLIFAPKYIFFLLNLFITYEKIYKIAIYARLAMCSRRNECSREGVCDFCKSIHSHEMMFTGSCTTLAYLTVTLPSTKRSSLTVLFWRAMVIVSCSTVMTLVQQRGV